MRQMQMQNDRVAGRSRGRGDGHRFCERTNFLRTNERLGSFIEIKKSYFKNE